MANELMRRPGAQMTFVDSINHIEELMSAAEVLIKSGFMPPSIKTPAQAITIILTGREMGIPAMQSLRQLNVINGKVAEPPELMLAMAYRDIPGFAHKILESTDKVCKIQFAAPLRAPHVQTFTIEDAIKMGLAGKDNWKKQPKVMLQWRCTSAGMRFFAPDAICGMGYTPEELGATVNEEGEIIGPFHTAAEMREILPDPDPNAEPGPDEVESQEVPDEEEGGYPDVGGEGDRAAEALPGGKNQDKTARQSGWTPENAKWLDAADAIKKKVGRDRYYEVLGSYGFSHADEVTDRATQKAIYKEWLGLVVAAEVSV